MRGLGVSLGMGAGAGQVKGVGGEGWWVDGDESSVPVPAICRRQHSSRAARCIAILLE